MGQQGLETWERVLESVEHALSEASVATAKREQELATTLPGEAEEPFATRDWQAGLIEVDGRLQELRARAEQAEHAAAEGDTALAEAEVAFREWLAAVERAGRRLADWATP
ncbi:MAG TPA: hypothetical protein VKI65_15635 [Gemmataceae bacterium]|nr:hypothetical protein [Gemmataceae bacterium]